MLVQQRADSLVQRREPARVERDAAQKGRDGSATRMPPQEEYCLREQFLGFGRFFHFGTLKIAMRFEPRLMVSSSVPTNTWLRPITLASRQPVPLVILSPLLAFLPRIAISVFAMWKDYHHSSGVVGSEKREGRQIAPQCFGCVRPVGAGQHS
jgi:hypothetical protein